MKSAERASLRSLLVLAALAAVVFLAALLIGSSGIGVRRALEALGGSGDAATRSVLLGVRLPRVLAAFGVGSLLALSGVLLQALFRNPLADPYVLGVSGGAAVVARPLNVLAAGELRARTVGLALEAWRTLLFVACATLTALAVVSAGTVGFVGLITPHAVRLTFRTSDHRIVAPAAALAGGMLLAAADLVARTIASPRQLPVGAIMALVGAPLFMALLRSRGR